LHTESATAAVTRAVNAAAGSPPGHLDESTQYLPFDLVDLPDKAVLLRVDDRSGTHALDRSQPVLPMMPGMPERPARLRRRNPPGG
jgi:hypothetical protein